MPGAESHVGKTSCGSDAPVESESTRLDRSFPAGGPYPWTIIDRNSTLRIGSENAGRVDLGPELLKMCRLPDFVAQEVGVRQ